MGSILSALFLAYIGVFIFLVYYLVSKYEVVLISAIITGLKWPVIMMDVLIEFIDDEIKEKD